MKALLITICLLFICGCPETKPLHWYPSDSIQSESLFDVASEAFEGAETWETTVSTKEAIKEIAKW